MKKFIAIILILVSLFSVAQADNYVKLKADYSRMLNDICDDAEAWLDADELLVGAAAVIVYMDLFSQGLDFEVDNNSWSPAVYVTCDRASNALYFAFHDAKTDKYFWCWYEMNTKALVYDSDEMKAATSKTTARRLNSNFVEVSSLQFTESVSWVYQNLIE